MAEPTNNASHTSKHPTPENNSEHVAVPPKNTSGGSNKKTLIIVLVVVFVIFLLPGFIFAGSLWWWGRGDNASKLAESIIETSTGGKVDVDSNDGQFSIKGDNGEYEISSSADLPDNFPADVPVYEDMRITASWRSSSDEVSSWTVTGLSDDSSSKVNDFFDDKFSSWDSQSEYAVNDSVTTVYKKDNLTATVTVGVDNDGKTTISYIVAEDNTN